MKTKFTTFGGGLITGLLLMLLVSATTRDDDEASPRSRIDFRMVPLDTLYKSVARYRTKHVDLIRPNLPRVSSDTAEPSRMFIYEVRYLEDFFLTVKSLALDGGLDPKKTAIRFYYGVYWKGQKHAGHDYGSLHTLFMVPNYWSENDQSYRDIELVGLSTELKKLRKHGHVDPSAVEKIVSEHYLQQAYRNDPNTGVFMLEAYAIPYHGPVPSLSGSIGSPIPPPVMNQGQLCPPNCPNVTLLQDIDRTYDYDLQ